MDILYLLVPISILLVFITGIIFWWALNNRQFEALDDAGGRILNDDKVAPTSENSESTIKNK
jgi:cbb3-type cytochrome oxidase maturation protein